MKKNSDDQRCTSTVALLGWSTEDIWNWQHLIWWARVYWLILFSFSKKSTPLGRTARWWICHHRHRWVANEVAHYKKEQTEDKPICHRSPSQVGCKWSCPLQKEQTEDKPMQTSIACQSPLGLKPKQVLKNCLKSAHFGQFQFSVPANLGGYSKFSGKVCATRGFKIRVYWRDFLAWNWGLEKNFP